MSDVERAKKMFPEMRDTRALKMLRIHETAKTDRTAAIKQFNSLMDKGSASGGLNPVETKAANKWYKDLRSKLKAKSAGGGGRVSGGAGMMIQPDVTSKGKNKTLLKKE